MKNLKLTEHVNSKHLNKNKKKNKLQEIQQKTTVEQMNDRQQNY